MFFKKQNRTGYVPEEIRLFQNGFSHEQKCAIIGSLMILSQVDRHMDKNEVALIENTTRLLGVNVDDLLQTKLKEFKSRGTSYLYGILSSLTTSQKEWFVVTVHMMMSADGSIVDEELWCLQDILNAINFSVQEYVVVVEKFRPTMDDF